MDVSVIHPVWLFRRDAGYIYCLQWVFTTKMSNFNWIMDTKPTRMENCRATRVKLF